MVQVMAMQKWEYLSCMITPDPLVRVSEVWNDNNPEHQKSANIINSRLRQLGDQGWELVQIDTQQRIYFFKRPKED